MIIIIEIHLFVHIETVHIEHLNSLGGFVTTHMYFHNAFD